jgi:hypothetical protein
MEKNCSGCKETLSLNEFYKNKTNEDGKSIYCKVCTKLNAKKYYQKKLLKQAGEAGGMVFSQTIFPSNFINMGDRKTEMTLKIVMIQRLMLTINNELNDLLKNYSEQEASI